MGRKLMRVPLDFDAPLGKVWQGFVNPHYVECDDCNGSGQTTAALRLGDIVALLMLSGEDAQRGVCHPYFDWFGMSQTSAQVPSVDMTELTSGLSERSPSEFGHDACDRWRAVRKIIEAAGLPESWGECQSCHGHGIDAGHFEAYELWQETQPPEGEGFQIWETVSEGSPISPVFSTPEELARYMAGREWGADKGSSYEDWMRFIKRGGISLSMVIENGEMKTGPNAALGAE